MPSGRPCAAEAPRGLADKPPCSRSRLHTTQLRRGSRLGSSSPLFGERPLLGTVGLSTTPTSVLGEPGHPSSETGGQNWILKMRHTEFCRKGQLCGGAGGRAAGRCSPPDTPRMPSGAGPPLRRQPQAALAPSRLWVGASPAPRRLPLQTRSYASPAAQSQPQPEGPVWTPHLDLPRAQHLSDHPKIVLRPCVFTLPYLKAKNPSK